VLIGSGVTAEKVSEILAIADGAIVGSAACRDGVAGSGVDAARAHGLVAALRPAS
jgi:predicted TIM-barrel enzyme